MNLFKDLQVMKKQAVAYIEELKSEYAEKSIMFFSVTNKVAKIDFIEYPFGSIIESEYVVNELNKLPFKSGATKRNIPKVSVFATYLWNLESPAEMAAVDEELNWFPEAVTLYLTKEALKMGNYKLPEQSLAVLTDEQRATLYSHSPFMEGDLLCFYRNAKDFFACKVTKMRPGRALKFMLQNIDNETIKIFVGKLQVSGNLRIEISKNFVEIYTGLLGTGSCMAGGQEKFTNCLVNGKFVHPVTCYNHPESDISIAAVYEGDLLIGRALVNSKNQHSRVFSNNKIPNSHWRVTNCIDKKGFTYSNNTLEGRPLLKIELDCGGILCPFIEPGNAGVEIHEDYLIMFGGHECDHELGMVKGYTGDAGYTCDNCGTFIDDDDDEESFLTEDGEIICPCCLRRHYTQCYSFELNCWTYVRDNSSSLFMVKAACCNDVVSNGDYITGIGHSDYVRLDDDYYGSNKCAHSGECSFDSGGYALLTEDLDRFNLFFCYETDAVERKEDYAWFDFELMRISEVDMSEYELMPDTYEDDMPMYRFKPE